MAKKPIIIIGMGEMAGVFARGFLRSGYPVYPITREMDIQIRASELSEPELVLVAVAEKDIQAALKNMPEQWKDKLVLLQNELLPGDWTQHQLQPTVISVWFEKKKGQDYKVLIPSPCYGQKADILVDTLASIDIAARKLNNADELLFELVVKMYIYLPLILQASKPVALFRNYGKNTSKQLVTLQLKLLNYSRS